MIIFTDGACNFHTKKSGIGAAFFTPDQIENEYIVMENEHPVFFISEPLNNGYRGQPTNNEAEYMSLVRALQECKNNGITDAKIFMDSSLVVNQVNNKWKINKPHLLKLKKQVDKLKEDVTFELKYVPRRFNTFADHYSKIT